MPPQLICFFVTISAWVSSSISVAACFNNIVFCLMLSFSSLLSTLFGNFKQTSNNDEQLVNLHDNASIYYSNRILEEETLDNPNNTVDSNANSLNRGDSNTNEQLVNVHNVSNNSPGVILGEETAIDFSTDDNSNGIYYEENIKQNNYKLISMKQKLFIAEQINSGKSTSKEISDQFDISTCRANVISRKIKLGNKLYSKTGRPRALDFESENSLNVFINSLKKNRHQLTIEMVNKEIKNKIKEEFIKTKKRNNKLDDTKQKVRVPQRTLRRYLNDYKVLVGMANVANALA